MDALEKMKQDAINEFNRRILARDFVEPEKLKGKSNVDMLLLPEFTDNLKAAINEQLQLRKAVKEQVDNMRLQGKRVQEKRHVLDRVIEMGLMEPGLFAVEFAAVLYKRSELPAAVREYVKELGMKAYNKTTLQLICEANPDMAELRKKATIKN